MSPRQVRRKLNGTTIIVGIGCSDAHGFYLLNTANLFDDGLEGFDSSADIVISGIVSTCLDSCCGLDVATCIDNTEYGISAS